MLAIAWSHGISPRFLGKHQLFQGPGGWIMRRLGGIPVDRSDPSRIVDEVIALIASGEEIQLVVTPEGTRGAGTHWRSGFHRIAVATGLPVTIAKTGGDPVDARSILMVMGLGVGNDDEVTLSAEGDGADDALDQLVELLEIDHDAP